MGLLRILKKLRRAERSMRILVLGLDNAGKTTIVKQLRGDDISEISPTLGFSIETLMHSDNYTLNIWDVGGQTSLRSYWRNYYESTDGIIWVIDINDTRRINDCFNELWNVLKQDKLAAATLCILANKYDINKHITEQQLIHTLQLNNIENRHWKLFLCSGVTGEALQEGIDWLVHDIAKRIYMME